MGSRSRDAARGRADGSTGRATRPRRGGCSSGYGVRYVFVGELERRDYPARGAREVRAAGDARLPLRAATCRLRASDRAADDAVDPHAGVLDTRASSSGPRPPPTSRCPSGKYARSSGPTTAYSRRSGPGSAPPPRRPSSGTAAARPRPARWTSRALRRTLLPLVEVPAHDRRVARCRRRTALPAVQRRRRVHLCDDGRAVDVLEQPADRRRGRGRAGSHDPRRRAPRVVMKAVPSSVRPADGSKRSSIFARAASTG